MRRASRASAHLCGLVALLVSCDNDTTGTDRGWPRRIGFSRQGHIAAVANAAGFITFVR